MALLRWLLSSVLIAWAATASATWDPAVSRFAVCDGTISLATSTNTEIVCTVPWRWALGSALVATDNVPVATGTNSTTQNSLRIISASSGVTTYSGGSSTVFSRGATVQSGASSCTPSACSVVGAQLSTIGSLAIFGIEAPSGSNYGSKDDSATCGFTCYALAAPVSVTSGLALASPAFVAPSVFGISGGGAVSCTSGSPCYFILSGTTSGTYSQALPVSASASLPVTVGNTVTAATIAPDTFSGTRSMADDLATLPIQWVAAGIVCLILFGLGWGIGKLR